MSQPTLTGVGTDRGTDSNPNAFLVVLNYKSDQTIDFGFVRPAPGAIGDFVWHDLNRNGLQDSGEPGIDGVTVRTQGRGRQRSAHDDHCQPGTALNGYYQFTGPVRERPTSSR